MATFDRLHALVPEVGRRRLRHDGEPWQKELLAEYRLARRLRTGDGMQFDEALALVSELETPTPQAQRFDDAYQRAPKTGAR